MAPRPERPTRERYFIQIKSPDESGTPLFVDVSQQVGKLTTVEKPLAAVQTQVYPSMVLFSVLNLWDKRRAQFREERLQINPGPFKRMHKHVTALPQPLAAEDLSLNIRRREEDGGDLTFELKLTRDHTGVADLEMKDTAADDLVELPRGPLYATLYLNSPATGRTIAVGWQGFLGKPGDPRTAAGIASFVLNHISGLTDFHILSGISSAFVPPPPGRTSLAGPKLKAGDAIKFHVPLNLWAADQSQGMIGKVSVEATVNLDKANLNTNDLCFDLAYPAEFEELAKQYESVILLGLTDLARRAFDDEERKGLCLDILLGELDASGIERLRTITEFVGNGYHVNPHQAVPVDPAATA